MLLYRCVICECAFAWKSDEQYENEHKSCVEEFRRRQSVHERERYQIELGNDVVGRKIINRSW